jgi:hypothetical protein
MAGSISNLQSVLQTNITERIQQVQQQHPDMQQRYFEIQLREERRKMLQKVKDAEEADRVKIRDEEGRKRQAGNPPKQEAQAAPPETEETNDAEARSHVDLKV